MELDASFETDERGPSVAAAIRRDLPQGSEGAPHVAALEDGVWSVHGSLRDRDEDDVPDVRSWFERAATAIEAPRGTLELDPGLARSRFRWNGGSAQLEIPPHSPASGHIGLLKEAWHHLAVDDGAQPTAER